jgi:hypothetical protein
MKKIIAVLFVVLMTALSFGQNFEGKITYKNKFTSRNPKITDEQWSSMMGTNQEYFIKDGNYKSLFDGTFIQWQLYINKENKFYSKMYNPSVIWWNDAGVNSDSVLKVELNKNVIDVLGYTCDELVLTCRSGIQKYYFNSKLAIDSKLFINHKYENWFFYLSKANAVPLKYIINTDQFIWESIATEVKPMKLENQLFELPPGTKTDKSPY